MLANSSTYSFKEFNAIFISKCLTLGCRNSLEKRCITTQLHNGTYTTTYKDQQIKGAREEREPFCFHPCQPCCQLVFCWHCRKHAVQCFLSSSWCLNMCIKLVLTWPTEVYIILAYEKNEFSFSIILKPCFIKLLHYKEGQKS